MLRRVPVASLILLITVAPPVRADHVDRALELLRSSPVFKVRAAAALSLGGRKKDTGRVLKPLTAALKDRHRAVRAAAALALGKLGAPGAIPALSEAMGDDDTRVSDLSRKSLDRVVKAFVKNRGRFADNNYAFRIRNLTTDGEFKDEVMVSLLKHKNVEVGTRHAFDDKASASRQTVELDLSGRFVDIGDKKGTLSLTLSLNPGGYVVTRWKRITARGASRKEVLARAARVAATRVLAYLGAQTR